MKFFKSIAATAAVIGGSIITTATPASAQYYGNGYGYNNGVRNGYGSNPRQTHRNTYTTKTNGWGRTYVTSPRYNQQCSGPCY